MSFTARRILYISFVVIYLIITPLIMLYAAGYKFSGRGISFQKTGMFILDSQPHGAKVLIDSQPAQTFVNKLFLNIKNYLTTPAKIKNLLPGEYEVRLELDGYWNWEKKLKINPGSSTYAEDVFLFKKNIPVLAFEGDDFDIGFSPDKSKLAIVSRNRLAILNLAGDKLDDMPLNAVRNIQTFGWSLDGNKIILDNIIYGALDLSNKTELKEFLDDNISELRLENNDLYYVSDNSINYFSLSNHAGKKIIEYDQTLADYLPKNNNIYYITGNGREIKLRIFSQAGDHTTRIIDLPPNSRYRFINQGNKLLNIYDEAHQMLYLVDPDMSYFPSSVKTLSGVKRAYWIDDKKLVYASDFEIWTYNLTTGEQTLINRISEKINGIIWHPSNNYIIYATNNNIFTIELDVREKRNVNSLVEFDKIDYPVLNPKGDIIYFSAKIAKQEGLWKLALQ